MFEIVDGRSEGHKAPHHTMIISYKKLFKLLIDRNLYINDLAELAHISPATLSKMKKDGANISSNVLVKICLALDCAMDDITEFVPKRNEGKNMYEIVDEKDLKRFAVITFEDTIFWDSDDVLECQRIFKTWEGEMKGIYDYERSMYLDEADIIDLVSCQIHSED